MAQKISKTRRKQAEILGVELTGTELVEVLMRVGDFISHNRKFYIVTPNPELILMAQSSTELKRALNQADIAIPDGVGLKIASRNLNIIKGRELFLDLVKLAHRKKWRIFFLGGLGDEAELAAKKLGALYFRGPELDNNAEPVSEVDRKIGIDTIKKINKFKPHLLFVAFGNPKQEIWINKNLERLDIGGAMAVGGTFRYIAGLSKLPPKWMEEAGLEWLWRLINEPFRFRRVWNAVVIFPITLFRDYIYSDLPKDP